MYRDRRDAGRWLAAELLAERAASGTAGGERVVGADTPIVVGLPRGGVPVAFEVARALGAPLDVLVARKLGAPGNPEYGIGAIAEGDVVVLDQTAIAALRLTHDEVAGLIQRESAELDRRAGAYRDSGTPAPIAGRTVILVDDGLATGVTATAAARALRKRGARHVVLAVPVGAPQSVTALSHEFDAIVCPEQPERFLSVGLWYADFSQIGDDEVVALLAQLRDPHPPDGAGASGEPGGAAPREFALTLTDRGLPADLTVPAEPPIGLVIFAHGSGSSRHSSRNRMVARELNRHRLATLLFDLLTDEEARDRANVFDIGMLAERLAAVTRAASELDELRDLPVGLFGASTGAAAALVAAAELGHAVGAVVSRGGRPDLAGRRLAEVHSPTLLLVGGLDHEVLRLNRTAMAAMSTMCELRVIPHATHLFEEPGTLELVAENAAGWFTRHLTAVGGRAL